MSIRVPPSLQRFLPLLILFVAVGLIWGTGLTSELTWANLGRHQARLTAWVSMHPLLAPCLYLLTYIVSTALSLPQAIVLTLMGGLLFGAVAGTGLAVVGATAGATVLFLAARSALGGAMARRGGASFARVREALARDGFSYLLAIRLVPIVPFWIVNLAASFCGMRLTSFAAATFIGIAPATFVFASIGAGISGVLAAGDTPDLSVIFSLRILGPLIGLAILSLAPVVWKNRSSGRNGGEQMADDIHRFDIPPFDIIVIGAGAAGLSVTAGAAQLGARVALIERDRMGGDCLNSGCVPSKALLAASHTAGMIRHAGRFGLRVPEPSIDWDAVRAHVHGVIAAIAPNDSEARFRALGVTVIRGEARFIAPDAVMVDGKRLVARRIVVAAGTSAVVPPIPGLSDVPYLTNATLFALEEKPAHLLILGGGPIGLEMADAFAGLGCRVTVVEAATISARDDPELVAGLRMALSARGVAILEGSAVATVEPGPALVLADGRRVAGSHLLVAVGRHPCVESLNLDAGKVAASRLGVITDAGLRSTTNKRVFAVGDIADPVGLGPRAFTHVAGYHAGIVIRRALFRLPSRVDYTALPHVTYTSPELAQVGLTEAEARNAGHSVSVLRWPLSENDRAVAEGDTTGLVKLIVAKGRVIGAGILAPNAGEMIGQWTLAIAARVKLSALAGLIVPYPTRSEAGKRAAGNYYAATLFSERTRRLVRFLGRLPW